MRRIQMSIIYVCMSTMKTRDLKPSCSTLEQDGKSMQGLGPILVDLIWIRFGSYFCQKVIRLGKIRLEVEFSNIPLYMSRLGNLYLGFLIFSSIRASRIHCRCMCPTMSNRSEAHPMNLKYEAAPMFMSSLWNRHSGNTLTSPLNDVPNSNIQIPQPVLLSISRGLDSKETKFAWVLSWKKA